MKACIIQILMLLSSLSAWSQADKLDSLLSEIVWEEKELMQLLDPPSLYGYLLGGIAGDSRTIFTGQETGQAMYSLFGSLYIFHTRGFFAGASGSWFSQFDPGYHKTILSAGINTPINRKKSLYFRVAYSRYVYHAADTLTGNIFNNNLGTGMSYRNKWIGMRLNANVLFGKEFGMNFSPVVFSRIPVIKFGKYNKIQLEPELSAFIGSEAMEYENSLYNPQSIPSASTADNYGLLSTQFYLPLCLYLGDLDIELGYFLNIPLTQDQNMNYPVSSFFSFTIGYLLPLN